MNVEYLGNMELLEQEIVAFLAPSQVSPLAVLPTLDWASEMARMEQVVVSGFTSRLEKEVWSVLARGTSPIVLVTVQHRYKRVPKELRSLLDCNRLLIISLGLAHRLSRPLAAKCNAYVASLAAKLVFPSIDETSTLYLIYQSASTAGKTVTILQQ